jgi:hypothetical protein
MLREREWRVTGHSSLCFLRPYWLDRFVSVFHVCSHGSRDARGTEPWLEGAHALCLLDMLPAHRVSLPLLEFDKPRLCGPDYLLIKRRD